MSNFIVQGVGMGGILCTKKMNKLGKIVYEDKDLLYTYKGTQVPCLQMVDDILTITKCNPTALTMKLKLFHKKCSVIHVGKKLKECPTLKVHKNIMNEASSLTYLGDTVHESGKTKYNLIERRAKGYAIFAEIRAILEDVPYGIYRTRVGLQLRQAMFINGVLFNSESWHGVNATDMNMLSVLDHQILRFICGAQAKTPSEFLYLETGALLVENIISYRRMIYLRTILTRNDSELQEGEQSITKRTNRRGFCSACQRRF